MQQATMPIDPDPSSPTLLSPLLSWPGGYVIGRSRPISERPLIARTTDTKSAVRIYVRLHAKSPRSGMCDNVDRRYAVAKRRNVSPTQGIPCSKPKGDATVCNIDTRKCGSYDLVGLNGVHTCMEFCRRGAQTSRSLWPKEHTYNRSQGSEFELMRLTERKTLGHGQNPCSKSTASVWKVGLAVIET